MNTGGLSGGEENSQSYYSDSSSIPSSFSDCEDLPIQELQFSGHQTSFSDELKLLLARDKGAAEDPVFENGNSVPLSHGAPVSQSGQFIGAIVEPGSERGSVPIISPGKEFHHLPLSPTSSSSAGHQTASGFINLVSEEHRFSSNMSRTLPAKLRDKSQPPQSVHPPVAGTSIQENDVAVKDQSTVVLPINSSENFQERGAQNKRLREGTVSVSHSSEEKVPPDISKLPAETADKHSTVSLPSTAVTGYSSTEEDTDLRQQSSRSQKPTQQQTAFPIPPLPEHTESLMRQIDTSYPSMPNVSPDSGIQSFAGSPSGNDSPSSVASVSAGEQTSESQSSTSQIQPQTQTKEQKQQDLPLLPPPPPPPPPACSASKKATGSGDEVSDKEQSSLSSKNLITETLGSDQSVEESFPTEIPSPFRGPSIGRKKRGRPSKRKKSQMLQHKQSTLYSGLYTSDGATSSVLPSGAQEESSESAVREDGADASTASECAAIVTSDSDKAVGSSGSVKAGTVSRRDNLTSSKCETKNTLGSENVSTSESKNVLSSECEKVATSSKIVTIPSDSQTGTNRAGCSASTSDSITDDMKTVTEKNVSESEAPAERKRGPGRPKGSKNKRCFTVIKNKIWKDKVAKGLVVPCRIEEKKKKVAKTLKDLDRSSEGDKVVKKKGRPFKTEIKTTGGMQGIKSKKGSKKRPLPFEKEAEVKDIVVAKKKRGRPRKYPLGCTDNSRSNLDAVSKLTEKLVQEKTKAMADSELALLIRSVQNSIQSQFPAQDLDEMSEFADSNSDITAIEPSLPRVTPTKSTKSSPAKSPKKVAAKPKKPKLHVMMRQTKRRKRKRLQKEQPKTVPSSPIKPPEREEVSASNSSFRDLSQQQKEQQPSSVPSGSLFGPSASKPLGFFNRYRPSKILKQSSFRLHSSALGSALNRNGDDSSGDEDREGSEGRRKKKKKKLLYFKSKHKNIIDPAFVAELSSMESSMAGVAISEQAFIRVKPGEVPLPSIFKLTIIDVKKKKKDKLVLEPPPVPEKSKKAKVRKDSKEREPSMPELVKEKGKNVRKKSQSEDTHPPSLEIQVARDQHLPPKKRHKMMYEAESYEETAVSPKETPHPPEKRKVGRPRKIPLSESSSSCERLPTTDSKGEGSKAVLEKSAVSVTSSARATQKKRHSSSGETTGKNEDSLLMVSTQRLSKSSVLTCPRHMNHRSMSDFSSCAECNLLAQSQPHTPSTKSHSRQQTVQDLSPQAGRQNRSKPSSMKKQKLSVNQSRRKGSASSESQGGQAPISQSTSPRSRTKAMAASLPSAEVVINPLPDFVVNSRSTRKSLNFQCNNTSDLSDCGADDESVIRSVCSEFEPLPLEHCHKRSLPPSEQSASARGKKRAKDLGQEDTLGCGNSGSGKTSSEGGTIKLNTDDSQPPRKRYQRVGLFSDFYKDDEPKRRNEMMVRTQTKSAYSKGDSSPSLLPPPIHFGKHFREMVIDFQLPYDIWWLYDHDLVPKKEGARPKFRRIRSNVYVDVKPNTRKFEPHPCNCKKPANPQEKGCLDDCLNRVVFTECTSETCPCENQCSNRRIQRQDWAPALEKFLTEDRGFGVRTLKPIEEDRIILEYLGEVVSETEFRRRMTEEYANDSHHYCLNMDGRTVIDGYRMGNITRFVNHSCEPNCEMQKWNVNGLYHMVLLTLREIKPNEEISYDYNFHSFNLEAQQACRCGSSQCRGVIGGKFQRSVQVGQHSLRSRRASTTLPPPPTPLPTQPVGGSKNQPSKPISYAGSVTRAQEKKQQQVAEGNFPLVSPSMKPMSQRERLYARRHSIFLVRNIDHVRGDKRQGEDGSQEKTEEQTTLEKVPDLLSMTDSMNDNRSVKTRLVAFAEENPELLRRHKLAVIFNNVYNTIASCRDEAGQIMAAPLMVLPSRKKYPDYYLTVTDPIDLTTIRNNIKRGHYVDIHTFDADLLRLFKNVEMYCGKKSEMGRVIARLRLKYQTARAEAVPQVEEVTGEGVTELACAAPSESDSTEAVETKVQPVVDHEEEDVIRCICGVYRDEGVMIQCEKCFIWQHCDCVGVKESEAEREDLHYRCEVCDPRPVKKEILDPQKKDQLGPNDEQVEQYLTLMKGNLQVAQGDCVYLLRDYKRPARSSLRLVAASSPDKMDIFRIEDLFKNIKGERFAAGHLYLRPMETFHEPNRKFFHNELFRYPQFETYPLDQVAGKCIIMDLNSYCKGKPKGFDTKDIYICEYRVDKTAHLFTKISKKFPINTKSFCFDKYAERLYPKRTYVPHEVPEEYLRRGPGDKQQSADNGQTSRKGSTSSNSTAVSNSEAGCKSEGKTEEMETKKVKPTDTKKAKETDVKKVKVDKKDEVLRFKMEEDKIAKKERINKLVLKIHAKTPSKEKLDLSYLLEEPVGKRPRKKATPFY
ncbi:histone-lysine N-methyltransferase ASH1L-like isoform X2 [Littorina saxatilis]|uniref:histone-lysine N-methyltransferase ASH1L-like isoform X2 n=1 Tax=Littorina saxatilis TaxID=31220 RepID=UPI0038B488B0